MSARTEEKPQEQPLSPEAEARVFELATRDYERLAVQEQTLMNRRPEIWLKFIAIVSIPGTFAGAFGLKGAIYLVCLVPFFLACISIDIKHDEQVLRYDVRKKLKKLAADWKYKNHDSDYSDQDGRRWWAGYYKYGKAVAFLVVQLIASALVSWYFFTTGQLALSITLGPTNLLLTAFTGWCLL